MGRPVPTQIKEEIMNTTEIILHSLSEGQASTENNDLKEAEKLLMNPRLFDEMVGHFNQSYLGREKEKKLLYLITLFTKLNQSTLMIITGETSSGKSSLIETVTGAIPEEEKMPFTATSERFFLYLNKPIHNKVLIIYEIEGIGGLNFLKTFISEGRAHLGSVIKTREGLKPIEIKKDTRGLVCITTTTRTIIDEEISNRGFILNIETPPEMIKEIILRKQELKPPDFRILKLIYKLLKPVDVVIPFLNRLADLFPHNEPRRMRDFDKIVNLVKAHALLYQYQRERTSDGRIIATTEDYKAIYNLADIIIPAFSGLTDRQRRFLAWLKPSKTTSQVNAFCRSRGIPRSTYYYWLRKLIDCGLVDKELNTYIVIRDPDSFGLPSPEEIYPPEPQSNGLTMSNQAIGQEKLNEINDLGSPVQMSNGKDIEPEANTGLPTGMTEVVEAPKEVKIEKVQLIKPVFKW
jgi:energy-coupling factor transporter ATP-binding protein EcfA2